MNNQLNWQRQTSNVTNGTGLQGYVRATYDELVSIFGKPEYMGDYDKITHQWVLNIEGVIATIYDYKENLNTGITEAWHIGGKQKIAERLVNQIVAEAKQ